MAKAFGHDIVRYRKVRTVYDKMGYCLLKGVCGLDTNHPEFYCITANGAELVTSCKNRPKGVDESQAVAQMIFQLGEDGWEFVFGQHVGESILADSRDSMWFKRPKL